MIKNKSIIGIVCDNYKLPKFEELLKKGKYDYTVATGVTEDTKLIKVTIEDAQFNTLKALIETAEMITTGANKNKN